MYKDFYASLKPLEGKYLMRKKRGWRHPALHCSPGTGKPAAPSVAGESGTVFGLDFGDHAAADTGRGGQTVLCPFYGSTPGHHLARAGGRRAAFEAVGGTWVLFQSPEPKKAAVCLMEDYGGQMPASRDEILKLPGIGSYTAGAVASIAYDLPAPALDGNVVRVLTRLFADPQDSTKPALRKKYERRLEAELVRRTEERFLFVSR